MSTYERYDPAVHGTYGAYLRGKGLQVHGGRSTPVRRERRDEDGRRHREVTSLTESGAVATTTNRTDKGGDHQDVHVRAPLVTGKAVVW
ncbi:hypothetical protein [Nonomuraea lactucae]|uniref:hypothetical protein n=1 Tax=Nonomuraea lactucae TaxID=2249762 RepID=UPI000DE4139B|nr:hypothetical protein [Nonomuraea lactucae]